MRVIAGTARSLPLETPQGMDTRPTTDRIKETLFNMLSGRLPGSRFLDLFAGSGAIGIEALSRGAAYAAFVEQDERALRAIRRNLDFTHLTERGEVFAGSVQTSLAKLEVHNPSPFDIIFLDPPYGKQWERKVLEMLTKSRLMDRDTLVIAEASLETDFSWTKDMRLTVQKEKKYKTNQPIWLRKE